MLRERLVAAPLNLRLLTLGAAFGVVILSSGCTPARGTKVPELGSSGRGEVGRAVEEAGKGPSLATVEAHEERLYCEGQSWSSGHLPNPFARHYATFKGISVFGGEHARVHSEFEYEDVYGSNAQLFSSKKGWPAQGRSEEIYRFHYQKGLMI